MIPLPSYILAGAIRQLYKTARSEVTSADPCGEAGDPERQVAENPCIVLLAILVATGLLAPIGIGGAGPARSVSTS